jgi:hypothetical protein
MKELDRLDLELATEVILTYGAALSFEAPLPPKGR